MIGAPLFLGLYGSPRSAGTGGGGPSIDRPVADYVYRPGGVEDGNVYITFAAAIAAAQSIEGRALIRVDDSIVSPAPVPAGAYDLEGITLAGDPDAPASTLLQLDEGVTWTEFRHAKDNLQIDFAGTTPPCTDLDDEEIVVIEDLASLSCSGPGAFFSLAGVGSGERGVFYIRDGAYFNNDIGPIIDAPNSGSQFDTYLVSGGAIESDTISGVVGSTWRVTVVDGGNYSTTQPDFLGTLIEIGGGITAAEHRTLRQLIHFIDNGPAEGFTSGAFRETLPSASITPTSVTWWASAAKTMRIVEKLITYSGIFPTTIQWRMYDTDGVTILATVTDTISYSGAFELDRTRVIA